MFFYQIFSFPFPSSFQILLILSHFYYEHKGKKGNNDNNNNNDFNISQIILFEKKN